MTAALYSSRPSGSKKLTLDGIQFGWGTIEKITNAAKQNKKAAGGGIFGLATRPRSYNNNIPSLVDMAACEV